MSEDHARDLRAPLLVTLAIILALAFWVFRPFLLVASVAACVALLLAPAQRRLSATLGSRPTVAAALLVLVTTALILVPVLSSLFVLVQQAAALLQWLQTQPLFGPETLQRFWQELPQRVPGLRPWIEWVQAHVAPTLEEGIAALALGASGMLQGVLGRATLAALDLVLFLLILFFLLRDGRRLLVELRPVSPFSPEQERQIFDHLERTVWASLQAVVVVPVVQGILAGIGFMLFGVPSPLVWGTAVMLAATVPILGSPLGWLPACGYLFLHGSPARALGLLVFCAIVVSGSDNVIKPMLLRGTAQIHPLLGFLSILGGILAFGVFGFLIGPVVLSLVLSALRIYRLDVLRGGAPSHRQPAVSDTSSAA